MMIGLSISGVSRQGKTGDPRQMRSRKATTLRPRHGRGSNYEAEASKRQREVEADLLRVQGCLYRGETYATVRI